MNKFFFIGVSVIVLWVYYITYQVGYQDAVAKMDTAQLLANLHVDLPLDEYQKNYYELGYSDAHLTDTIAMDALKDYDANERDREQLNSRAHIAALENYSSLQASYKFCKNHGQK